MSQASFNTKDHCFLRVDRSSSGASANIRVYIVTVTNIGIRSRGSNLAAHPQNLFLVLLFSRLFHCSGLNLASRVRGRYKLLEDFRVYRESSLVSVLIF